MDYIYMTAAAFYAIMSFQMLNDTNKKKKEIQLKQEKSRARFFTFSVLHAECTHTYTQ